MSKPETASLVPTASTAVREQVEELYLAPVEGMPRWMGRTLADVAMYFVSMEEQPMHNMQGAVTPTEGYFRRDRYFHPRVDANSYRLRVSGVADPKVFDFEQLKAMPREERVCVQECAGNGNHLQGSAGLCGQAVWSGPSLETVLEACGGVGDATNFVFRGLDTFLIFKRGYHYGLSLEELRKARALIAVEMNGAPLSRRHGFPARLIVPKIYSMSHVKWLGSIEGQTHQHMGWHNRVVFVNKVKRGGRWVKEEARWIGLKSIVSRCIRSGSGWELVGWAWGGDHPIDRVEVSTDSGASWSEAEIIDPHEVPELRQLDRSSLHGHWVPFRLRWNPGSGAYRVASRAYDAQGNVQLDHLPEDVHGHFNQTHVKWRDVLVP